MALSRGMEFTWIFRTCGLKTNRNANRDNIAPPKSQTSPVHDSERRENTLGAKFGKSERTLESFTATEARWESNDECKYPPKERPRVILRGSLD